MKIDHLSDKTSSLRWNDKQERVAQRFLSDEKLCVSLAWLYKIARGKIAIQEEKVSIRK